MLEKLFLLLLVALIRAENRTRANTQCMTPCKEEYPGIHVCYYSWRNTKICDPADYEGIHFGYKTSGYKSEREDCIGACKDDGSGYSWCFIDETDLYKWDYCSVRANTSSFGYKCESTCTRNELGYGFRCKVEVEGRELAQYCSPPHTIEPFSSIYRRVKNACNHLNQSDFEIEWNEYIRLLDRRILNNPDDENPVTFYTIIRPPNMENLDNIQLVGSIEAVIKHHHLRNDNGNQSQIPVNVSARMRAMNALPDDETTYLLSESLGGPSDLFNFVPRSPSAFWKQSEEKFRNFLRETRDGWLHWRLIVLYDNLIVSRRPAGFLLDAVAHHRDYRTDEEHSVRSQFINNIRHQTPQHCVL